MTECQKCRDWKGCLGKEFYNYAEIQFCIHQVAWLIRNAETMRRGDWPAEPDDNVGTQQVRDEAAFTNAVLVIAEVDTRLEETGDAGKHLVDVLMAGVETYNLSQNPRDALYYISGWNRKRISFNKWRWQKQQRNEDKMSSKRVKAGI